MKLPYSRNWSLSRGYVRHHVERMGGPPYQGTHVSDTIWMFIRTKRGLERLARYCEVSQTVCILWADGHPPPGNGVRAFVMDTITALCSLDRRSRPAGHLQRRTRHTKGPVSSMRRISGASPVAVSEWCNMPGRRPKKWRSRNASKNEHGPKIDSYRDYQRAARKRRARRRLKKGWP